jgi:diguanylate cyclase (GGDEF)-like protein/PAS domain S-box-containing protein
MEVAFHARPPATTGTRAAVRCRGAIGRAACRECLTCPIANPRPSGAKTPRRCVAASATTLVCRFNDMDDETAAEPTCVLLRNEMAMIVAAHGAVAEVLGWTAPDLEGRPSTTFVHPDDQAGAVAAWFAMIDEPGATVAWQGRYRAPDGTWRWVETENANRLDDPDEPRVISTIRRITQPRGGIEEELRSRKQLLSRLYDALPVGLFQIDARRNITFTNDRLHVIMDTDRSGTADDQFARVHADDRDALDRALQAALTDQTVDDLEVRFEVSGTANDDLSARVCLLSLRSLTDNTGVVTGAIGCLSDVTDSAHLRHELQIRATVDALTGCLNRAATLELLEDILQARGQGGVAVVFVDLDNFKSVNDRYGHAAGDEVLRIASRRLQQGLRQSDRLGRIGGDEFLVVLPNVSNGPDALDITNRLSSCLHGTVTIGNHDIELQATLGVAWTDKQGSADELIAHADNDMYRAKNTRRARDAGNQRT